MWQDWLNGFFGLWVVVLGFLDPTRGTHTWALVVSGFVISILGFWAAGSDRRSAAAVVAAPDMDESSNT